MADNQKQKKGLLGAFDLVSSAVIALSLVAVMLACLFRIVTVDGLSMTHTLQHGDVLFIGSAFYTPEYSDIVVVNRDGEAPLVKRIIGLPGDRIRIGEADGLVYRNGEPLTEPYTRDGSTSDNGMREEVVVPDGQVFVMGDNRHDSLDSRIIGSVPIEDVLGRALFRLFPNPTLFKNGE